MAIEVKMHAYENYWGGKAKIENLIFSEITDSNARNIALLSGDVDYINPMWEYYPVFEYEDGIVLNESELGATIQYLGMNNKKINMTLRRAVSKAIDYDYLIETLTLGHSVRLKSPILLGIWSANWSFHPETYNVTAARQLMQFMGYAPKSWNATYDPDHLDSNLDHVNWRAANFITWNYTYNIGNSLREDMLIYLADALQDIGIKVLDDGMTWGEFIYRLYEIAPFNRNMLDLYFIGWIPAYNDPSNFINPLFTNRVVGSNGAQYNGSQAAIEDCRDPFYLWDNVQLLMEAALGETDTKLREQYYDRIQYLLVERDVPWAYVYSPLPARAYDAKLKGMPPYMMLMDRNYFYPCYWERDYSMVISSPSDITYEVGDTGHSISWTITADDLEDPTYFIYENNSLIYSNNWTSGVPIVINVDGLPVGVTQYRIEAHNSDEVAEDIVIVTVEPPPTEGEEPKIPGYSLIFLIGAAMFALFYMSKRMGKKIK